MPSIVITMSLEGLEMAVAALCGSYGYSATLPDGSPNPQTPIEFAGQCYINYGREITKTYQARVEAEAARVAAVEAANARVEAVPITIEVRE